MTKFITLFQVLFLFLFQRSIKQTEPTIKQIADIELGYPHEIFPEILQWKRQDEVIHKSWLDDYRQYSSLYGKMVRRFLQAKENGDCLFVELGGHCAVINVKKLKKGYINLSLEERIRNKRDSNLLNDFSADNYNQFLQDFKVAYKEISQ